MKHYPLAILLGLALLLQISGVCAEKNIIFEDTERLDEQDNEFVEGPKWKENDLKLPAYPKDGDLVNLRLDNPGNRFEYFLDEKSLAVSEKDYVVRYTMVIESSRGTRNVFYEGIRCDTEEYKTYAFGSGKRKLRVRKKPEWKGVSAKGFAKFRLDLIEYYFCEWKLPRQPEIILNRIKYSPPSEDVNVSPM